MDRKNTGRPKTRTKTGDLNVGSNRNRSYLNSVDSYRTIVETSPEGIYRIDTTGRLIFVNKALADMLGYQREELIGLDYAVLLAGDGSQKVMTMVEEVFAGNDVHDRISVKHSDGHTIVVSFTATPLKYQDRIVGITGYLRDLTDRKEAKDILRWSEERWRLLAEYIPDIIINIDRDRAIQAINRVVIPGLTVEEVIGKHIDDFVLPEHRAIMSKSLEKVFRTGKPHRYEVLGTGPEGPNTAWYETRVLPVMDKNRVISATLVSTDITEKKKAEEALQESEERWRSLVENAPNIITIVDRDGTILSINRTISEFNIEDTVGTSAYDYIDPEYHEIVRSTIEDVFNSGEVGRYEIRGIGPDGGYSWYETHVGSIKRNSQVVAATLITTNITEHKQIVQALRHAEEQFRALIENSLDAISILNHDGTLRYRSPSHQRLLGYDPEETLGKHGFLHLYEEDIPKAAEAFTELFQHPGAIVQEEVRTWHKDGSLRTLKVVGQNLLENPAVQGIVCNISDVTERKQAEEQFSALVRNVPDAVFSYKDGRMTWASDRIEAMLGYTRDELVKQDVNIFMSEDVDLRELIRQVDSSIKERGFFQGTTKVRHKDGHVVDVEYSASPIPGTSPMEIVGVARDVTERKKAEESIKQRNKELAVYNSIAGVVSQSLDLKELLDSGLQKVLELMHLEMGGIYLVDPLYSKLELVVHSGVSEAFVRDMQSLSIDDIALESVIALGKSGELTAFGEIMPQDEAELSRVLYAMDREQLGFDGIIQVLLMAKDNIVGLMLVGSRQTRHYSEAERQMLITVGRQIALAIENAQLYQAAQQEIAERKKTLKELEIVRSASDNIVESASALIMAGNIKGELTIFNKAYEELTGYTKSEMLGKPFLLLMPEEDHQKHINTFQNVYHGMNVKDYEITILTKHDERKTTLFNSALITDEELNPVVVGIGYDITYRKQAEEALKASEEKYRVVIDNASEAIVVVQDGVISFYNPITREITGYSDDELINKPFIEFVYPEDRQMVFDRYVRRMRGEEMPREYDFRILHRNGDITWVVTSVVTISWEGKPAIMVFLRDVTEQRRVEEAKNAMEQQVQLAGRLAAVGELAAGVAHELNNPLAAIQAYAELMAERDDLEDILKSDIETVYTQARRATRITKNLLSFARKHSPEKSLISLNEVVERSVELNAYRMRVNNIEISTELDRDLPMTMADFHQMQQVFVNIITNAEQVMKDEHGQGEIRIKTQKVGKSIHIVFSDNGPGIPEENIRNIFDPFFTTKDVGKGTGLGLSICYGIVQGHDGSISVDSKPGEGATFIVEIPVVTKVQTPVGTHRS